MGGRSEKGHCTKTQWQFSLRTLFLVTTSLALVSGFSHYLGGMYLLQQVVFILFTIAGFAFLCIGPLVVTELLVSLIDWLLGLSSQSPLAGRRRFE